MVDFGQFLSFNDQIRATVLYSIRIVARVKGVDSAFLGLALALASALALVLASVLVLALALALALALVFALALHTSERQ